VTRNSQALEEAFIEADSFVKSFLSALPNRYLRSLIFGERYGKRDRYFGMRKAGAVDSPGLEHWKLD
jgi:hypothetical protein